MTFYFRNFNNGEDPSEGYVEAYLPPDPKEKEPAWWRLLYTDNDSEDVYEKDVRKCIKNYRKKYNVASSFRTEVVVLEDGPISLSEVGEGEGEGEVLNLSNACESDDDSQDPHQLSASKIGVVNDHEYDDADAFDDATVEGEVIADSLMTEGESQMNEKIEEEEEKEEETSGTMGIMDDMLIDFLNEGGLKDDEDCSDGAVRVGEDGTSMRDMNSMEVVTDNPPVYWSAISDTSTTDDSNSNNDSNIHTGNSTNLPNFFPPPGLIQPQSTSTTTSTSKSTFTGSDIFCFLRDALGLKIVLESVQVHSFFDEL